MTERVQQGHYVGLHQVNGRDCHHLAFRQKLVDWQIWIDAGEKAVPRKLLIIYKKLPDQPRFGATLDDWNLSPNIADDQFVFAPPPDARRVEPDELLDDEQGAHSELFG